MGGINSTVEHSCLNLKTSSTHSPAHSFYTHTHTHSHSVRTQPKEKEGEQRKGGKKNLPLLPSPSKPDFSPSLLHFLNKLCAHALVHTHTRVGGVKEENEGWTESEADFKWTARRKRLFKYTQKGMHRHKQ